MLSRLRGAPGPASRPPWGLLLVFAGLGGLLVPAWAHAYSLAGRVVNVADGDTLTLLVGQARQRVRLASIDAPETGHGRLRPGQPFGQAAKRELSRLVAGRRLQLHCYERDHYGRHICDVPLPDGRQASHALVASGLAWANQQGGGKYLRDDALLDLERRARQQRLGLWRQPGAVAPWVWRWQCWKALETRQSTPICSP